MLNNNKNESHHLAEDWMNENHRPIDLPVSMPSFWPWLWFREVTLIWCHVDVAMVNTGVSVVNRPMSHSMTKSSASRFKRRSECESASIGNCKLRNRSRREKRLRTWRQRAPPSTGWRCDTAGPRRRWRRRRNRCDPSWCPNWQIRPNCGAGDRSASAASAASETSVWVGSPRSAPMNVAPIWPIPPAGSNLHFSSAWHFLVYIHFLFQKYIFTQFAYK